jgi:hypothetical protein
VPWEHEVAGSNPATPTKSVVPGRTYQVIATVIGLVMDPGGKDTRMSKKAYRYSRIMEEVFFKRYKEGATEVGFDRSDMIEATAATP